MPSKKKSPLPSIKALVKAKIDQQKNEVAARCNLRQEAKTIAIRLADEIRDTFPCVVEIDTVTEVNVVYVIVRRESRRMSFGIGIHNAGIGYYIGGTWDDDPAHARDYIVQSLIRVFDLAKE